MEYLIKTLSIVFSWPGVVIISVLFLREPLGKVVSRFIASDDSKAKIGPIEIELGKLAQEGSIAVGNLNEMNIIIARSRLIELEFAERSISASFTDLQRRELSSVIKELRSKLRELEQKNV